MFHGKMKALTFSYDDGVTQDQRLIALFNKYGLKATFNLNSGLLGKPGSLIRQEVTVAHVKPRASEVPGIYAGHEVAAHTLTHPTLTTCTDEEIIRQVYEDAKALSELVGIPVDGMAYPGGGVNYDDRVAELIRTHTSMKYARTTESNGRFDLQTDLFRFHPTVYHMDMDAMEALGERFLALSPDRPQLFYIWGHAYEFDIGNTWDRFERFCARMVGHDDIFYGTNREVLLDR